jgi:hypothetical protein
MLTGIERRLPLVEADVRVRDIDEKVLGPPRVHHCGAVQTFDAFRTLAEMLVQKPESG